MNENMSYFVVVGLVAIVAIVALAMMVTGGNKAPNMPNSLYVDDNSNMAGNLKIAYARDWGIFNTGAGDDECTKVKAEPGTVGIGGACSDSGQCAESRATFGTYCNEECVCAEEEI